MSIYERKAKEYSIIHIPLDEAREKEEYIIDGDVIGVIKQNGEIKISINEPDAPAINLARISKVVSKKENYRRIYITNPAQPGKECILYVGRGARFDINPKELGSVILTDSNGNPVNPATEETLETRCSEATCHEISDKVATNDVLSSLLDRLCWGSDYGRPPQNHPIHVDTDGNVLVRIHDYDTSLRSNLEYIQTKISTRYDMDETQNQGVTINSSGYKIVEIMARATAPTTYTVSYSFDGTKWYIYYQSSTPENEYSEVLMTAAEFIKLESAAAGSAGDTVDLILAAKP